jgi:HK97 family phage major capsid protein
MLTLVPELKEDALNKILGTAERRVERPALKAYEGVKNDTLAAKLREEGVTVGEYAEALGYDDAGAFLKGEFGVDIRSLKLEELWTSDELHGLSPELFLDTILMANLNHMVTHNFVTEIPIDRGEITIRTFEDAGQVYEVAPGGTIPDDQGTLTRRTHFVKKIGRGIGWTYEEQRRTPFPLVQIDLSRLGMRMALKEDLDVLNVLRTGIPAQVQNGLQPSAAAVATPVSVSQSNTGGSGIAAGVTTFTDLVNLLTDIANRNYEANFVVVSPVTYSKFLLIPQVSNYLNAGPMASKVLESGVISHFLGMDIYITKQMPDNEYLAGQKGFAGVKFVEAPLMLEEEKIISKQIERCQVTKTYVPAVLYTQALSRMPF